MKTGRNEPCPCGSGRKYKKCCLERDMASKPVPVPAPTDDPTSEPMPEFPAGPDLLHPLDDTDAATRARWDAFWESYEDADLEDRLAIAHRTILNEPDLDLDLAQDFVCDLAGFLQAEARFEELDALVEMALARCDPDPGECYDWLHHFLAQNAALTGRTDGALERALDAMCQHVITVLDESFHELLDLLRFRGLDGALIRALGAAIRTLEREHEWVEDEALPASYRTEFAEAWVVARVSEPGLDGRGIALELERTGTGPDLADSQIESLDRHVRILRRTHEPRIEPTDFLPANPGRLEAFDLVSCLAARDLVQAGWPLLRAGLGLRSLEVLLGEPMTSPPRKKSKRSGGSVADPTDPAIRAAPWLIPSSTAVRDRLDDLLLGLPSRIHSAAAFAGALPHWVRTTEALGLVSPEAAAAALAKFQPILAKVPRSLEDAGALPGLVAEVRASLEMSRPG